MTISANDKDVFNPEVCRLRHEGVDSEIKRNREEAASEVGRLESSIEKVEKTLTTRIDKGDSKFNALVLFILAAIGGIMSPVVVDMVKKLIESPVVR